MRLHGWKLLAVTHSGESFELSTRLETVYNRRMKLTLSIALACLSTFCAARAGEKITHKFLATGAETYIVGNDNQIEWTYPEGTRDGYVLPGGNLLLTLTKSDKHPGGAVVEVTPAGKTLFQWEGTQSEINTAQLLPSGNIMLTEAGDKPRVLELSRDKKIVLEFPISCQTTNHHMETRMTRKLPNGNYLVPHLLDKVVREYDPKGKIVWEVPTPNWAFTAIRVPNGNTLIDCTYGNMSIEVDKNGKTVWQLTNDDFSKPLIKDACGGQRLPNGNTVITAYGVGADRTKLIEVTPDKKVVWTYTDDKPHGIHTFQILETNGKPIEGAPMK
jgi:outer membrane protein assembly factor BamB